MPTAVVLDCDPGHDDAIALLLALASPELELDAVTTVAGNQTVERTTENALRVLELAGRTDIPVAAGAGRPLVRDLDVSVRGHGESGLENGDLPQAQARPVAAHAVDVLADRIRSRHGRLTLVATGPLTNVALLLERHPDAQLERIVLMGGAIGEGNRTPAAESNVWVDPEAAQRVVSSGLDVAIVPLEATRQALVRPDDVETLRGAGGTGRFAAGLVDVYGRFHERLYPELGGVPVHDALAVAHVIDPEILELAPAHVEVDLSAGPSYGRTNIDLRGRTAAEPNAKAAVGADAAAFRKLLVERLASLG